MTKLPRIEIRKDEDAPHGRVLIDGHEVGGVSRVALAWEAGDTPIVELNLHAGELTVDAEMIAEVVAGLQTLSLERRRAALAQLYQALTLLSEEAE